MSKTANSVFLKLTSAIPVDGEIITAGNLVEVDELLAKNLLHRGKAVLATAEDGVPAGDDEPDSADEGA